MSINQSGRGAWRLALLLSLTACATGYNPTPSWTIRETAFQGLIPGKTTKEDVRRQVGIPLLESHFPRQNEDAWEYRYLDGPTVRMLAYVHFDGNGRYKYTAHLLDPAFYNAGLR